MIERGSVWWAEPGPRRGSRPAKRRPVLVVQSNEYNESRLATVVVAVITSNTALAAMPGNVFLPTAVTGLPRDSVANVTGIVTLDEADLGEPAGRLTTDSMREVDAGLRRVLGI